MLVDCGCGGGADAADAVCAAEGVRAASAAHRGDQQGRSAGCAGGSGCWSRRRICSWIWRPMPSSSTFRCCMRSPARARREARRTSWSHARAAVQHDPRPRAAATGDQQGPLQVQVTTLDYDSHQGRFAIGRVRRGAVRAGDSLLRLSRSGAQSGPHKMAAVYTYEGLSRVAAECATVGDIVALTGITEVGDQRHADRSEPTRKRCPRRPSKSRRCA